jgi:hypothetical protein
MGKKLNMEKVSSEPTKSVIESIEPNLVSTALRKTAQVLTENEKEQARKNIGAQQQLQLTVKDNGNIVLSNLNGQSQEFMPATPSGDPMHWAYVTAGAEYNDTDEVIKKTAFWGEEVDHLPHHYYLNGLGDITEEQMLEIYNTKDYMNIIVSGYSVGRIFQGGLCPRTFKGVTTSRFLESKNLSTGGAPIFVNETIEVIKWSSSNGVSSYNNSFKLGQSIFYSCNSLRVIERCTIAHANSFTLCPKLEFFEIHGLATNFNISGSPLVKKSSIIYTIKNAKPTSAITITLHADAYARLANDADIVAALETKNAALEGTGGSVSLVSA